MYEQANNLLAQLKNSLDKQEFVKMSMGNYRGADEGLKNIYLKQVLIKNEPKLSFTYRYKTKDIVKNYSFAEAHSHIQNLFSMDNFRAVTLFTLEADYTIEISANGKFNMRKAKPTATHQPAMTHDKHKNRKIEAGGKQYLHELKITDAEGNVYKSAQDKYKQINHYIEILSTLLQALPEREATNIVDMGAGKGYLTFALYDYLNNSLKKPARIIGVEYRKDLVDLCNDIAHKSGFDELKFVEGTIADYDNPGMNVLIALHACDTATDDAIAKGIKNDADLIVVAPCCHKQVRREIEKSKAKNELDFLTRHGVFMERQAEMVTDGIRALILEYYGYTTTVQEFISDAHTPKNVLVVGQKKRQLKPGEQQLVLQKIKAVKEYFGIGVHHLEKVMGLA